jgi:hypothetical protein
MKKSGNTPIDFAKEEYLVKMVADLECWTLQAWIILIAIKKTTDW